jgi:ArsR family transcriptional regulator, arsenate/arsenite/antimonite-responsive transcriptional repressor
MRTAGVVRAVKRAAARPPAAGLLFRAFSDPTRLRILHLLQHRELCVGDMVTILRVPQAKASRHLTYLRRAGLVRTRRDGLWIHYSLAAATGRLHRRLLACLAACFQEMPELSRDARRCDAVGKAGGCC